MEHEPLGEQHLSAAQHAAPAAVRRQVRALQLRELLPVGEPHSRAERQPETLHFL